jgi:hypothetical protein
MRPTFKEKKLRNTGASSQRQHTEPLVACEIPTGRARRVHRIHSRITKQDTSFMASDTLSFVYVRFIAYNKNPDNNHEWGAPEAHSPGPPQ